MKQYLLKYSSFKILFVLIFVLAISNKLSANTGHKNTDLIISVFFSTDNFNDEEKDTEIIEAINVELFEEEEDVFFNSLFCIFQDKSTIIKRGVSYGKYFNSHLLPSEKKRLYILYCQLKAHL